MLLTATLLALLLSVVSVGAQSLQGAGGGLQPQVGQAQDSVNTQNRTGSVQTSTGGSTLNDAGLRPLGVVSNPGQAQPDTVVTPSTNLKADVTKPESSNNLPLIAALLFAAGLVGVYFLQSGRTTNATVASESVEVKATPNIRPEPTKPQKKRKTKKKKR